MTDELVEKVALAIADVYNVDAGSTAHDVVDVDRRAAQAAIAAMPRIEALVDLLWRAMDDASIEPGSWYAEARAALQGESDDATG